MKVYAVVCEYSTGFDCWTSIIDLFQLETDANIERKKQEDENDNSCRTFYIKEMKVL